MDALFNFASVTRIIVMDSLMAMDGHLRFGVDTARIAVITWLGAACAKMPGVCEDGGYVHQCTTFAFSIMPVVAWLWFCVIASILLVGVLFIGGVGARTLAVVWLRVMVSICSVSQSCSELSLSCLHKILDRVRWGKK